MSKHDEKLSQLVERYAEMEDEAGVVPMASRPSGGPLPAADSNGEVAWPAEAGRIDPPEPTFLRTAGRRVAVYPNAPMPYQNRGLRDDILAAIKKSRRIRVPRRWSLVKVTGAAFARALWGFVCQKDFRSH